MAILDTELSTIRLATCESLMIYLNTFQAQLEELYLYMDSSTLKQKDETAIADAYGRMHDKLKVAVALMLSTENKCVDTSDGLSWYFYSERQKQRNAIENLFKSATIFKTAVSNLVGSGVAGGTIPVVVGGVAVPSPEPSSSSYPSSNKLATPIHTATPLVINNYNNMSIFGKEVVGNDGRKILLTQRETTKEDYEGDSSASSQKGFMDMKGYEKVSADDGSDDGSDDGGSDDESDCSMCSANGTGFADYIFLVSCKVLLIHLNNSAMMYSSQDAELLANFNESSHYVLNYLCTTKDKKRNKITWLRDSFSVEKDGEYIMTNLSALREMCEAWAWASNDDDEGLPHLTICDEFYNTLATNLLHDTILLDTVTLLSDIHALDCDVGSEGKMEGKMHAWQDDKQLGRTVRVTTHENRYVHGVVLLESPLVLQSPDGKFTVFQNPPIDIQNV